MVSPRQLIWPGSPQAPPTRPHAATARPPTQGPWSATATLEGGRTLAVPGQTPTRTTQLNFKDSGLWNDNEWTYETEFPRPAAVGAAALLVFDGAEAVPCSALRRALGAAEGMVLAEPLARLPLPPGIKMGAVVSLNGADLGTATNQFLRYAFHLDTAQLRQTNLLRVRFPLGLSTGGRFMACSGGWDWAPYSNTFEGKAHTFSKGIWKRAYLVTVAQGAAAVTHVVPLVFYSGVPPTSRLDPGGHAPFLVESPLSSVVTSVFHPRAAPYPSMGKKPELPALLGEWGGSNSTEVDLPPGNSNTTVTILAKPDNVDLWWPLGCGHQPLYGINVSLSHGSGEGGTTVTASRRIGFRTAYLTTGNDTDPLHTLHRKGLAGFELWQAGFRHARDDVQGQWDGHMEQMEGRATADSHRQVVQSAADAGMNMLRLWGGGIYQYEAWYDACDELGVMVYHDMMHAQRHRSAPTVSSTVSALGCPGPESLPAVSPSEAEYRHQVRRLSHHPSIVMWDGCNECHHLGLSTSFVLPAVVKEDWSRVVWPSSPSEGWTGGVDRLKPKSSPQLFLKNTDPAIVEAHGPYLQGGPGGIDSGGGHPRAAQMPLKIFNTSSINGPEYPSIFASEFGASVYSSFESMASTLDPSHWGIRGGARSGLGLLYERNYGCETTISAYFGGSESDFQEEVIEWMRMVNSFGTIIWQLNEIWPTGGWGSLEYGSPQPGHVIGGRWKPLHYLLASSGFKVFSPADSVPNLAIKEIFATCGEPADGSSCPSDAKHLCKQVNASTTGKWCLAKNDSPFPFAGHIEVSAVKFSSGKSSVLSKLRLDMKPGPGATVVFEVPWNPAKVDDTTHILVTTIYTSGGTVSSQNFIPQAPPRALGLPDADVSLVVSDSVNPDGSVDVAVSTDATALFVTLTTLAAGHFDSN
eukprot:gene9525-250_t